MPRWTTPAANDLARVLEYIAAQQVARTIRVVSDRLDQFPQMGRIGAVPGTRELVVPNLPYILVYRQKGPESQILRILHTRRKWP